MQPKKTPYCFVCHLTFPEWKDLALHISSAKVGHHRSKKWAAKFLLLHVQKRDIPTRSPLSDQDKENKISTIREVSGEYQRVKTVCPRCKTRSSFEFAIEFIQGQFAWGAHDYLYHLCQSCGGKE